MRQVDYPSCRRQLNSEKSAFGRVDADTDRGIAKRTLPDMPCNVRYLRPNGIFVVRVYIDQLEVEHRHVSLIGH